MNKKMVKTATRLFNLIGKYINEFNKVNGSCEGVLHIKRESTGEVLIYAKDFHAAKNYINLIINKELV